MATEILRQQHTAGLNVYFTLWSADGTQVFDFADNAFKAIGSATTPYVAATERTGPGGSTDSWYTASVDLANVANTGAVLKCWAAAYQRAGGTPAPLTDTPLPDPQSLTIQFGQLGEREIVCRLEGALLTTAGNEVRFGAWLEHGGQPKILAAGSCTLTLREHGSGSDLFAATDAAPNAAGRFEITKTSPGFTNDRLYFALVEITYAGTTHSTTHALPVFG